ncbi:ABC transporter ATP-binding protein [Actinomadura spongiicola]|uniref:Spermidine/putrescine import ATP-binding protein PotA n=1 Tax=Actinomadura spongiicola TaxID=2303421 RepID=A0A372GCY3_9ACTN|nr:ABC transporter ATP-binding protein [Actinomadura spongiicola]RFS82943.1 ABC transporter ATP-binding protein [Actinomadura spongiicola]
MSQADHSKSPGNSHGIRIAGVSKVYAGTSRPAVDDVSLDIAPGEFITLLGPSGSGKTTMLSMLAGFVSVSAGKIEIDGKDVSRQKPHKRNLGVVFQQYALFPHMSVTKNIAFPLQQRRMPKAEIAAKVDEALRLVHLEEYADRLPSQLSGGQQQRVALARAVVYRPRALLMDEPLGALDRKLRDELQREIARMHRELGMTFIFVTHDQHEALTLSDRIAVFNEGRIEQVGTPSDLYERPETLFVAQFLGESTCFRGTVDVSAGVLRCGGFTPRAPRLDAGLDGSGGVAVVRPERLDLHSDAGSVPTGHNRVRATVTEIVYVGNHHQVGLRFADGTNGSAMRVAGRDLPAVPGEEVTVSWDPEHQSVVADPADEPTAERPAETLGAAAT